MPRFSIVIPTKQRADTLRHALETALAQRWDDFEIVVQNNGHDPATEELVRSLDARRVVYRYTDNVLPMALNWERAIEGASGEFLTVIGDDDGVLADACAVADLALRSIKAPVLMWKPHTYFWPDAIAPWTRNNLIVSFPRDDQNASINKSASMLERFYAGAEPWDSTPMIYNSFVHRSVIAKVKAKGGAYFATSSPDIYSGIANLWASEEYVHLDRALSIRGNSGHSAGSAAFYRSLGADVLRKFLVDNEAHARLHADMIATLNLEAAIANEQMIAKAILFPDDSRFVLTVRTVLRLMALNINRDWRTYEDTLQEIRALAAKHQIDPATLNIPPMVRQEPRRVQGPSRDKEGHINGIVVNGDQAGLRTIADAARLAQSMSRSMIG